MTTKSSPKGPKMRRRVRVLLAASAGTLVLAISFLVFWQFRPFLTESYNLPPNHEHGDELPVQSDEHIVHCSGSNAYPNFKHLLPDIDIEEVLIAGKRKARADRERQLALEVSKETTKTKVKNLLYKTYSVGDPIMEAVFNEPDRYISTLHRDPRVSSLMDVVTHGTKLQKQELLDSLVAMCHVYLEELPLFQEAGPWHPTVLCPGGGMVFPYLLRYVDSDATSLPILAQMFLRLQKATKEHQKVDDDEWFASKHGLIFAYAFDHFLYTYSIRKDLRKNLTARQLRVLKEYTDHREARGKTWNLELRQCDVIEFAVRFHEKQD